tara:strand:+ start:19530 stop:20042 length:513 start_codon:yes stop_codon:yes gene_type:complete
MQRISLIEPDVADPSAKRIMENLLKQFGVVIPPVKALAHKPDLLRAVLSLTNTAHGKGEIELGLKEILNIRASSINGCEFCVKMHSSLAQSHKVSMEKINGAKEGSSSSVFSTEEKAALRFCEESTEKVSVSDETFLSLRDSYSESAIIEIAGVVSTINLWNRIIVGLGF